MSICDKITIYIKIQPCKEVLMKNSSPLYDTFSFSSTLEALTLLPSRPSRSNKGDFGRVLCVCGSYGMAGAAYLCAKAAYRSGAGLVEIFTHESNRIILQTLIPEAIVTTYTEEYSTGSLLASLERADCVVTGCGLGVTPLSRKILSDLLHSANSDKAPLVLDADALNLISRNPSLLKYTKGAVITPHAKEMSRLTGTDVDTILLSTVHTAHDYAREHSLVCVLKDHRTAVSDGSPRVYLNTTGNSGMATGGSGDVLAGIIGGILSQRRNSKKDIFTLTALAVYIHGLAGDFASKELGEYSLMASDIIDALPIVLKAKI